jgi:hypothetical protein
MKFVDMTSSEKVEWIETKFWKGLASGGSKGVDEAAWAVFQVIAQWKDDLWRERLEAEKKLAYDKGFDDGEEAQKAWYRSETDPILD